MGLNKLNNKGYMLVEIVLASALAFGIAYFILDMTIKLKNKNDDLLVETLTATDQAIITNILMESIKENPNEFDCENVKINIPNKTFSYNEKMNIVNKYASVDEETCVVTNDLISVIVPINVEQLPDKNFDVNVVYYKNIVKVDNITVNGAPKETLTFEDSLGNITSVTTYNSGKASVSLKVGEYKLTGSVSGYSKDVIVDVSTTEINAYPDGAIYWYGNGDQSGESLYSVTGGFTYSTNSTNGVDNMRVYDNYISVYMYSDSTTNYTAAITSNNSISLSGYTYVKMNVKGPYYVGSYGQYSGKYLTPHVTSTFSIGSLSTKVTSSSNQILSFTIGSNTSGNLKSYIDTQYKQGGEAEIHAAWRE